MKLHPLAREGNALSEAISTKKWRRDYTFQMEGLWIMPSATSLSVSRTASRTEVLIRACPRRSPFGAAFGSPTCSRQSQVSSHRMDILPLKEGYGGGGGISLALPRCYILTSCYRFCRSSRHGDRTKVHHPTGWIYSLLKRDMAEGVGFPWLCQGATF